MIVWNRPITFMLSKNAKCASLFAMELGKFLVYAAQGLLVFHYTAAIFERDKTLEQATKMNFNNC